MFRTLALIGLLAAAFPVFARDKSEPPPPAKDCPSSLIAGQSTLINLSILRNAEMIPAEVRARYEAEVNSVPRLTRIELSAQAVAYKKDPSRRNRENLFSALRILVPIASRQILAYMPNQEFFEDVMQTGYASLWKSIEGIVRLNAEDLASVGYFDVVMDYLRKDVFGAQREFFRTNYSTTPVRFRRGSNFTFEEEILLFGDTAESRAKIAKHYGLTPEQAEREFRMQTGSRSPQGAEPPAAPSEEDIILPLDQRRFINRNLLTITPREERALRQHYFNDMTLVDTGVDLNVTGARAREITAKAERKFKHPSRQRYNHIRVSADDILTVDAPTLRDGTYRDARPSYYDSSMYFRDQDEREAKARAEEAEKAAKLEAKNRPTAEAGQKPAPPPVKVVDPEVEKAKLLQFFAEEKALRKEWVARYEIVQVDGFRAYLQLAQALESAGRSEDTALTLEYQTAFQARFIQVRDHFINDPPYEGSPSLREWMKTDVKNLRAKMQAQLEKDMAVLKDKIALIANAFDDLRKQEEEFIERTSLTTESLRSLRHSYELLKAAEDAADEPNEALSADRETLGRMVREKDSAYSSMKQTFDASQAEVLTKLLRAIKI